MSPRSVVWRSLLAGTLLFVLWLAWQALVGAFRQIPRSHSAGQKVETAMQAGFGLMSLPVVLTCFWQRRWAQPVRVAWMVSLAAAAGISALVWGPPMPLIGVLFAGMALLFARTVEWVLRTAQAV